MQLGGNSELEKKMNDGFNTASGRYCCNKNIWVVGNVNGEVSIPQAVGTVATVLAGEKKFELISGSFNTASGRYCCNLTTESRRKNALNVSIPQAVGTVATF